MLFSCQILTWGGEERKEDFLSPTAKMKGVQGMLVIKHVHLQVFCC